MDFLRLLDEYTFQKKIPLDIADIIREFFFSYIRSVQEVHGDLSRDVEILKKYLQFVLEQCQSPYQFPPYHQASRSPIDYLQFGLDFIEPLVIKEKSQVRHRFRVDTMAEQTAQGDNVILFANHQIEADPQAIIFMLRDTHPEFAEKIIFVAGHRVTTDPLAIPFSLGCNLLCIYSKKHIETPPELKPEKLLHNQRTMNCMKELLAEGGKCIYVAPSGGRDRPDESGEIVVAPFDPQSIELFRLIAKQSKRTTHFYPLALSTYHMIPPPSSIVSELSESRSAHCSPIGLCFGEELFLDSVPGLEGLDKHRGREVRAKAVWDIVNRDYQSLTLRESQ